MGIDAFVEKLGPPLATGIVLAVLTGAASAVMAWRDLSTTSAMRFGSVSAELQQLRADLDAFRNPGGRFTAHDGDRHWQRMDELDKRIREQEMRPPRLNPALDQALDKLHDLKNEVGRLEERITAIRAEQERLCARLQACKGQR